MLEFECLAGAPKYWSVQNKHRFVFELNETDFDKIGTITKAAFERQWYVAHVRGEHVSEDIIGQFKGYKMDTRGDKTIFITYEALNGDPHVNGMVAAHLNSDWIKVSFEERESPYGMGKRSKRSPGWQAAQRNQE